MVGSVVWKHTSLPSSSLVKKENNASTWCSKKKNSLLVAAAVSSVALFATATPTPVEAFVPSQRKAFHIRQQQQQQDDIPFSALFSTAEEQDSKATTSSSRPDLPDYGKTSVEVDKIKLETVSKRWRRKDLFGSSLVDQTLEELKDDVEFQITAKRYAELGAAQVTREERAIRRRALDSLGIPSFQSYLNQKTGLKGLERKEPKVLQINIGLYCNQACGHCHVESSPLRTEAMTAETTAQILKLLENTPSITTLDITGGAPELNPNFRYLVRMARAMRPDLEIIDRCNLTVLQEPGQEDLVDFLKQHKVRIVASLPCYSSENVDKQRGHGVFDRSIAALLALNDAGYGVPSSGSSSSNDDLVLDLVYNPLGAFLPPPQGPLQVQYKKVLEENFGILFRSLFTMTNMPIKRFADFLHRRDELKDYMDLLVRNWNSDTTKSLMCLDTVSVGFDGLVYDCDFNQQLGYVIPGDKKKNDHDNNEMDDKQQQQTRGGLSVFDLESYSDLSKCKIVTDNHCFGCTAGMGSSCQGTTAT